MAMGIVSDKDFEKEKVNTNFPPQSPIVKPTPTNSTIVGEVVDVNRGRGTGNVEVPNSLRNLIGTTAIEGSRQEALELAASFGISPSSVGAYTNGATSTANYKDGPNVGAIGKSKLRIAKKARGKLLLALNSLTPDKLNEAKARDLAGIAKDMSAVVKHMEEAADPSKNGGPSGPTFVFYSPQVRNEQVFEVVNAKE